LRGCRQIVTCDAFVAYHHIAVPGQNPIQVQHQCGFARAIRSDQRNLITLAQRQGNAAQSRVMIMI